MSDALLARGVARGIALAGALVVFGTMTGTLLCAGRGLHDSNEAQMLRARGAMVRLIRGGLSVAVVSGLVWLVCEAAYVSGTDRIGAGLDAIAPLLADTNFGHLLLIRLGLMIAAVALFGAGANQTRVLLAACLAAGAVVLQAGLGHGAAMGGPEGNLLLAALALHILAAGLWLGGLGALLIIVKIASPTGAFAAAARFSRLGLACVATIAATALVQGWDLIGSVTALTGTAYGKVALGKVALFVILLAIAAANRRLTARLVRSGGIATKRALTVSIGIEIGVGLAVIVLAGILTELPPGMDMTGMG